MNRNAYPLLGMLVSGLAASAANADVPRASDSVLRWPINQPPPALNCSLDTKSCQRLWKRPASSCLIDTRHCPQRSRLDSADLSGPTK